jgi:hypothetical protein
VAPEKWTEDEATIRLVEGGYAVLDRGRLGVTFHGPSALWTDWIVHPTLGLVASIFGTWLGRHAIHAGAVVVDGGAWALIGDSGAGKSTTLAWLAGAGYPILADDVVVTDGSRAFAGPRAIDLVPSSLRYLGPDSRQVGDDGGRHRVKVGSVEPEVQLRGWIVLAWGGGPTLRPIPPAERLGVLVNNLTLPVGRPSSGLMLDLASLPGFELRRPRRLESLADAGAAIVGLETS